MAHSRGLLNQGTKPLWREAARGAASYTLRDDAIMQVICPTSQTVFAELRMPATARLLCMGLFSIFRVRGRGGHAAGLPGRNSEAAERDRMSATAWDDAALSTVIVREGGRSSIPETSMKESRGHGVLDAPHPRGMTEVGGGVSDEASRYHWSEGPDFRCAIAHRESRDSGFDAAHRPGMTAST